MSNELIKKAYEDFNGVWPFSDGDFMIISDEVLVGDSVYDSTALLMSDIEKSSIWQWVGTKADFDIYGESLKVPEGATHKIKRKGQSDVFLKDLDPQAMRYSVWGVNGWVDNADWFVGDNIEKIEIADKAVEEKWMPDPDSMCEIKHDNEILSWKKAKYIGVNTVGSKKYAVVFFPYISEYKNYKLDDSLKFRPIKTEAVKDATDVYHACELLVKEGFKQCAG